MFKCKTSVSQRPTDTKLTDSAVAKALVNSQIDNADELSNLSISELNDCLQHYFSLPSLFDDRKNR